MATTEVENTLGVTDIRRTQNQTMAPGNLGEQQYQDVGSLRVALAASTAHGTNYYTTNRLDGMTKNDMVYALRLIQDAAGVRS